MGLTSKIDFREKKIVLQIALKSLRDNRYGNKFEGIVRDGTIDGAYSSFLLQTRMNGHVVSTLRLKGRYNLEAEKMQFRLVPNVLFYLMLVFPTGISGFLVWNLVTGAHMGALFPVLTVMSFLFYLIAFLIQWYEVYKCKQDLFTLIDHAISEADTILVNERKL